MPFPRSLKLVTVALRVFAVLALLWSATGDPFLTVRAAEPNAGRSPEDLAELSLSDLYRYQDLAFERSGDDGFGVDTDSWGSSQDPQTFSNGDGAGEGRTLAFPVLAAACTWTGSTSADWHNSANWAGCGVPAEGDQVTVPAGVLPNEPNISAADVTLGGLTVGSGRTMTIVAGRAVTISSSTLSNSGTITGTGTVRTQGGVNLSQSGTFGAQLKVASGTTTATSGTYVGPISVDAGATMQIDYQSTVTARGDLTVNGSIVSGGDGAGLVFNGPTLTNNGTINLPGFTFGGSGPQTAVGSGSWGSWWNTLTLNSHVSMGGLTVGMETFNINSGGAVTVTSPITFTTGTVNNYGTLALYDVINKTGGTLYNRTGGVVTGTAALRMVGTGTSTLSQSGTFVVPVAVITGTTNMNSGTYYGPVTVDSGARLGMPWQNSPTLNGDLTLNGSITSGGDGSGLNFNGANFENNGSVTLGWGGAFRFGRGGVQTLGGAGGILGAPTTVLSGSLVSTLSGSSGKYLAA